MFSVAHLHAVTDVISEQVAAEVASAPERKAQTAEERHASHAKQAEVMLLLDSAISRTQTLDSHLKATNVDDAKSAPSTGHSWLDQQTVAAEVADAALANAPSVPSSPEATAKSIAEKLTAKDDGSLNKQTDTLQGMAKSVEPIMKTFDGILTKPGLDQYNASINTAPIVGLKEGNVMYIQAKSNRLPFGNVTNDVWSVFSRVPAGFDVTKGTTKFFPYQGNLYITSGTEMWVKYCRSQADKAALKESSNNWPKMYQDAWEKVGDQCLPANDVLDVVPWALLSADSQAMKFRLLILTKNGALQVLQEESITAHNTFQPLAYSTKDPNQAAPVWSRIAYHNGILVGYDKNSNLWDIKPDFANSNYTLESKYSAGQDDEFTEFTANDVGLVVSKKDGFLYKRIAAMIDTSKGPKDGTDSTAKGTKWIKWIPLDGVHNLGVASPGVILDLKTLTESLRTRYLETQATLWPVVSNIKTFAAVHEIFLEQMNKAVKTYEDSKDTDKKKKIALKAGKSAVGHAKAWSKILTTMVQGAQVPVSSMAKQLSGVSTDLEQQIGILKVKLLQLKKTLEEQEKALSAANVGFWVGIGTLLLGVVGVIAGLATANPLLIFAGGALFIGGLIAASVAGAKADKAAAAVASTEAEIRKVTKAIEELTAVTEDFRRLDELYGILQLFWGRMLGECMSVSIADDAMMIMIGQKLLTEDSPSYELAMRCTGNLKTGAQAYMDLISKQGIKITLGSDDSDDDDSDEKEDPTVASLASIGDPNPVKSGKIKVLASQAVPIKQLTMDFAHAQDALNEGKDQLYESLMEQATETTLASVAAFDRAPTLAGQWFNIAPLRANAGIFLTAGLQANLNNIGLTSGEALLKGARAIGSLVQSQKNVVESLQATLELARTMSAWSNDPFSDDSEERMRQIEKYKKPAVKFCQLARDCAIIANNSFADINHLAQDFAADVKRKMQTQQDEINLQYRVRDEELRRINVPFPLELFGTRKQIMEYVQSKAQEIGRNSQSKIESLEGVIRQYEASLNSWATCEGQAVSWVEMCKVINLNLASTQSTLDAMGKELKTDALLYRGLMETQWHNIIDNASEVLSIVGLPVSGKSGQLVSKVLGFSMSLITNGTSAGLMSIDVNPSPKSQLQAAIGSDLHLAKSLHKSTSSSANFYSALRELDVLPFAADINSGASSKNPKAMLEIVTDIRRQYSYLAAANFETVKHIETFALIQKNAVNKLTSSSRRDVLIKQMLTLSANALKAALRTSEAWSTAQADFEEVCRVVQSNVDTYAALMKDLDAAVAKQQKELDDYIAGITADAIAVCTVSLAVGAAVFIGPSAAWSVISKLPTSYSLQGLGWKDTFKTYYKSLDISEKAACVARLKAFKSNVDTAAIKLTSAKDAFNDAVLGVQDTGLAVGRIYARLLDVSQRIQTVSSIVLTPEDVEEVVFNWEEAGHAAEEWTDEFSRQGISPILYQADIDVELQASEEGPVVVNGFH